MKLKKVWKHQNKKYKVSRELMIHLSNESQAVQLSSHLIFSTLTFHIHSHQVHYAVSVFSLSDTKVSFPLNR